MGTSRNRNAGHKWERDIVKLLKKIGYEAETARYVSQKLDDSGVDIVSDFPLAIQAKSTVNTPNMHELLTNTAAEIIFWRKNIKKNDKFYKEGEYVMLPLESFLELMKR